MSAVTAAAVKELRERSGAGMMDAKKALEETNGDMEAAVDLLRAKGLATAAKKSSRTAAEGLVGVAVDGTKGTAVEVNSQTDFVAKNEQFQDFVRKVTGVVFAQLQAELRTAGEHAVRLGHAFGDEVVNEYAQISLIAARHPRPQTTHLQPGIDTGKQTLRRGFFVAGGAIDLPGKEQPLDLACFKAAL